MKAFQRHAMPKRSRTVVFRLTELEYTNLDAKAAKAGLTANELARSLARTLDKHIVFKTTHQLNPQLIAEIKAIGNNLNQLAKHANLYGELPEDLEACCQAVLAILQRAMQEV